MNIAFINPQSGNKYTQPPLGLLSLATVCKAAGHYVEIRDFNLTPDKQLKKHDLYCLTAMTPDITKVMDIAEAIKISYPESKIILGGVHATIFPWSCAETKLFDCVVTGEGEEVILDIIEIIESGGELPKVWNYTKEVDLNMLPIPDYGLIPLNSYRPHPPHGIKKHWTSVLTSRGCPYSCSFCSKAVFGKHYRSMSVDKVIELLADLEQRGVEEIAFYDDVFTLSKERTLQICNEIINRGFKFLWTCETRVHLVDVEMLRTMKAAGCYSISYGIESGSQEIVTRLNKGITLDQIKQAVKLTHEAGIQAIGYFMIGSPGETTETIEQTIDFAIDLKLDYAQFGVTSPLPGSELYNEYILQGHPTPDWENFKYVGNGNKPVFSSPELSRQDIEDYARFANKCFYLRPEYIASKLWRVIKYSDERNMLIRGLKMYIKDNI